MANAASDFGKQLVTRTPEVAGGVLRSIIEFAINGNSAFPGAKTTAARSLQAKGEREAAIDQVVLQHIGLASAQGFLTSVGGLITLPVGLPANLAGLAVLSVRMIGSIAHLRGYDVDDRRVRAALTLAMLGDDEVRRLVADGKLPTLTAGDRHRPDVRPRPGAKDQRTRDGFAGRTHGRQAPRRRRCPPDPARRWRRRRRR